VVSVRAVSTETKEETIMHPESVSGTPESQDCQQQVGEWIRTRFGATSLFDTDERSHE
jgi:hypothetical protein